MKRVKVVFLLVLLSATFPLGGLLISPVSAAVDPTNYSDITVDGYIDPAEWVGNVSVYDDPDTVWGGAGVDKLYAAINETGLFLGLESMQYGGGNPRFIWIDSDENGGIHDHAAAVNNDGLAYSREINFTGMMPDFFIYGGGNGTISVFNYTGSGVDDITSFVLAEARNQSEMAGSLFMMHYEVFIPFTVLYGASLPTDSFIKLAAAHFGGGSGDTWADILPNDKDGVSTASFNYAGFVNLMITVMAIPKSLCRNQVV